MRDAQFVGRALLDVGPGSAEGFRDTTGSPQLAARDGRENVAGGLVVAVDAEGLDQALDVGGGVLGEAEDRRHALAVEQVH